VEFPRRGFLRLAASAVALPVLSGRASAQSYPSRPVHVIVGFPAGNAPDIITRLVCQFLSEHLGQQFVVENHPGAGGTIATEAALSAPADGYTLLAIVMSNTINVSLYPKLKYDLGRDLVPVASIADAPFVMLVNEAFPAKTVPEFIDYAKAHPGKIMVASGGIGTATHVIGEMFKMMAKAETVHVPYRGNFMPDLISGQVQVSFAPIPQAIGFVRAGKLRALAVTTQERLAVLPDVPTIGEFLPGFAADGWYGLGAPRNTPAPIVDRLGQTVNLALADPKVAAQLAGLGVAPLPMTPAAFGKVIAADIGKWAKVIKFAGIKAE
jgi:tripartite-type tricarboxylate transporter receptor subunit TctC